MNVIKLQLKSYVNTYNRQYRVEASIIMGCVNSKKHGESQDSENQSNTQVTNVRSFSIAKFVPSTYEYVGLDKLTVDELLGADRTVSDRSIRDVKTWAKAVYVYDGDTSHIVIDYEGELTKLKCRVYGIDTPEIRTKNAKEKEVGYQARDRFKELTDGRLIWVHIINDDDDKYGRYLVKFYMDSDEVHAIDSILINENLGYEYFGGTKIAFDEWYNHA